MNPALSARYVISRVSDHISYDPNSHTQKEYLMPKIRHVPLRCSVRMRVCVCSDDYWLGVSLNKSADKHLKKGKRNNANPLTHIYSLTTNSIVNANPNDMRKKRDLQLEYNVQCSLTANGEYKKQQPDDHQLI